MVGLSSEYFFALYWVLPGFEAAEAVDSALRHVAGSGCLGLVF